MPENLHTPLGRTGLKVSRLCLGTMNFGPQTSEADSHAIMDKALELGIQFFDTADVYGWKQGEGVTEKILGTWFARGGARRERTVLATKVYNNMSGTQWYDPVLDRGLSARKIIACCEASLRRMQTDWIDLYQMHHIDRACPWEEIWEAMETLLRQGKIRYVGSSNFAGWDIATANQEARRRHFYGLVSEQSVYNLTNRTVELEVVPACRHYGLGIIPWSPLAGGLLGGVLDQPGEGRRSGEQMAKRIENNRARLEPWEALCREMGEKPADVALAWLLSNPVVTAPIIGPRTMEQLEGSMRALEITITGEIRERLEAIFPGPGGEAPKAYAW
jgi:aryl-alcohol dehydrogenase-like predicted oxidoreductase